MINVELSAESNKLIGIALISLFALITLAAFTALFYSIIRQHRNDRETLPEIDGFGGVDSSKESSETQDDGPSVFYLEEDEAPLPGAGDAEGEEFLRETRKAQRRSKESRRGVFSALGKK